MDRVSLPDCRILRRRHFLRDTAAEVGKPLNLTPPPRSSCWKSSFVSSTSSESRRPGWPATGRKQ
jgi:hypothetical protein